VNQPSGELVAYALVGSFDAPLDFPADGDWRLWLRGWMDGFRGGSFALTWDGEPFYASVGRHEFSSDSRLRFDWLDLGSVRLTQGRHVLGVTTTGDCGHMFDVLVLTTDPAYRPDETQPLPRLTRVQRLTPPEGLANLAPGLYMTESPIPWGKPLAGGPLRTLWVCGGINEREIVELRQRLDLAADVISSDMAYYGSSIFGSDLSLDQGDLLYDLLASANPYDVTVLVRTRLDQVPEHALTELLRRVQEGMGLIVVRSQREGEAQTTLADLCGEAKPLTLPAFRAPFDLNRQAQVSATRHGRGRILVCAYANWGALDQLRQPSDELPYPFWEYQLGHWVKLLQRAGQRDAARLVSVTLPEVVAPGQEAALAIASEGTAGTQVAGVVWAPHERIWQRWGPVPCAGGATVSLTTGIEDGLYHVQASLLNAAGEVLDSTVTYTRVAQPTRIAGIRAEYRAEADGQAAVTLRTSNAGAATQVPACLQVWGARGRLLGAREVTLDVAAGEGEVKVSVPVMPSWERLLAVRVSLGPPGRPPWQRLCRQFLRPQRVALDDYIAVTATHENQEAPTYCWPAYARLYDAMGMGADYPGQMFGASLESGVAAALIFQMTAVGSASTGPGGERIPCLHDPEMWAREEPAIRQLARHYGQYSPLVLGLGDEMGVSHSDEVCFSGHTLAAFRARLRQGYGTIEALNATWQTDFRDWDAVMPWRVEQTRQRPANIAPWLEFRVFMTQTFVEALAKMQQWVSEEVPGTFAGGANPLDESHKTCSVFSRIYPVLDYAQVYPRFHDRARSWFRDPRRVGLWSGYGYDRATTELHAWLLPAYGGTLMCWFGAGRTLDYRTLTNTLGLGEPGQAIRDCNRELQSGIGKLLILAEVEPEPVAILSAWRSKYAYTALKAAQSPTVSPTGWDQEFDEFLQGWSALLRKLRVPYRFVDEDQIERGALDRYRMLIAPQACVLSETAVGDLQTFARQHPVVADQSLATYDEHGRQRATPPVSVVAPGELKLVDLGDRPLRLSEENLARVRQVVEAAGVAPTREVAGDLIDFVVRKRLGDMRLLVVFGRGTLSVVPPAGTVAYDARAHRLLGSAPTALVQERSPAVLAFVPQPVAEVSLAAPRSVARGQALTLDARVQGAPLTVVRLSVTGPDGQPRPWYDANVAIRDGRAQATFRPALNDPVGAWTFTATEIISGATATAGLTVE
jgi:hypothetical protein